MLFRRQGPSLTVETPAKLNLFLEVRGRRSDGYHELETVMVSISLFDTLRFTPRSDDAVSLTIRNHPPLRDAALPADDRNLVVRAAQLLKAASGASAGAEIELFKRIPLQAGMGGGSSDAAATLAALNRLWGLKLNRAELHRLAAELGSDVNFFLDSVPAAVCRGRGEQIEPITSPRPLHFVVVRPGGGLSTAAVFNALGLRTGEQSGRRSGGEIRAAIEQGDSGAVGRHLHNALLPAALKLNGDVADAAARLRTLPVCGVGMTGSGTACYALCATRRQARLLAGRLRRDDGGVWSVST